MAATPLRRSCPIRIVCFQLAAKGSELPCRLFLDGEGQICAHPRWLPAERALLVAHNQQLIWGAGAQVWVL